MTGSVRRELSLELHRFTLSHVSVNQRLNRLKTDPFPIFVDHSSAE